VSEIDDLRLQEARAKATAAAKDQQTAEEKRLQAVADREAAELARDQARAELDEWKASAADRKRTADLAAQGTQFDNLTKLQSVAKDMVPDLQEVKRGELTSAEGKVGFSTLLKVKALADAADRVRQAVKGDGKDKYRVFVTADPLLLQRDAMRKGLTDRLSRLAEVLEGFLGASPDSGPKVETFDPVSAVVAAATGLSKAIPGVLSLFAAHRTLTVQDLTVEDAEAVAAVAGSLASAEVGERVVIDSFRFLESDPPPENGKASAVLAARDRLQKALIDLQKALAVEKVKPKEEADAAWIAAAEAIAAVARDTLDAADTIPSGGTMSPLTAAVAVEHIRLGDYQYVLLVQEAGASVVELASDRALAMKDPIHVVGTVALAYQLIDPQDSHVIAAGVEAGHAEVIGRLGSKIEIASGR
jgi:hypothetical protein